MIDEALDVLGRIAEEQSDLVRELSALAEAADELRHAARAALIGVARLTQQLGRQRVLQVAPQLGGTVEVKERLPLQKADRQQAQALRHQQPVQPPDVGQQVLAVLAGAGKQASRLDARERRRALTDQNFFRHLLSPPPVVFHTTAAFIPLVKLL